MYANLMAVTSAEFTQKYDVKCNKATQKNHGSFFKK